MTDAMMDRYEFSEENKDCLLHFLQMSRNTRNDRYCNLVEYQTLSKFISLDIALSRDLDSIHDNRNIIDITESDEEVENVCFDNPQAYAIECSNCNTNSIDHSTLDDILYSIKESLQVENHFSSSILNHFNKTEHDHKIFNLLSEKLNCEEVLYFGKSLLNTTLYDDAFISTFFKYILLKKLRLEYSDQLQELLNELVPRFSERLLEELTQVTLQNDSCSKVVLQYVDGLNPHFKQQLFGKFVTSCEKLDEKHIPWVELLTASQVEVETLSKFFGILSNGENNFTTDKSFGKLLMNIMNLLGRNIIQLEQPLKHIIGSHKSIWKSKLQKKFDECLQENSILSQSRC